MAPPTMAAVGADLAGEGAGLCEEGGINVVLGKVGVPAVVIEDSEMEVIEIGRVPLMT